MSASACCNFKRNSINPFPIVLLLSNIISIPPPVILPLELGKGSVIHAPSSALQGLLIKKKLDL